jgi:hypothetical protein
MLNTNISKGRTASFFKVERTFSAKTSLGGIITTKPTMHTLTIFLHQQMSAATQCRISRLWVVQGSGTAWWPSAEVSWPASRACTSGSWRQRNLQRGSCKRIRETQCCVSNGRGTCSCSILSRLQWIIEEMPCWIYHTTSVFVGNTSRSDKRGFLTCGCGDYTFMHAKFQ